MKLFTKICLIISLAFVCIGTLCLGIGAALGSGISEVMDLAESGQLNIGDLKIGRWYFYFNPDDEAAEPAEMEEGMITEQFLGEEIHVKYGEVLVLDSDTDQIEISVDAPKRNKYECRKEGDTLILKDQTSRHFLRTGIRNETVTVTICIPEGKLFDEVELSTNAGSVTLTHALSAEEIDLSVDAGELTAETVMASGELSLDVGAGRMEIGQFAAAALDAECGMGEFDLCGTVAREACAKCGMGQIDLTLNGREEEYNYEISCGMGDVSVNGDRATSGLSAKRTINNGAEKNVKLDCGMGRIDMMTEE